LFIGKIEALKNVFEVAFLGINFDSLKVCIPLYAVINFLAVLNTAKHTIRLTFLTNREQSLQ
jgi:hypothetical protein